MTDQSIKILEDLYIDDGVIDDLKRRVDLIKSGNLSCYHKGYYIGYINSLYDIGIINGIDHEIFMSEINEIE